jgi:hypothetical protein
VPSGWRLATSVVASLWLLGTQIPGPHLASFRDYRDIYLVRFVCCPTFTRFVRTE